MKFKQYLNTLLYEDFMNDRSLCGDLISYLMEMKVIKHDPSIKKVSPYKYEFTINDTLYSFIIDEIEYLPGISTYNIYFGPKGGTSFDRLGSHNASQVRNVFQKVITCMILFIDDINPDEFTFTGYDNKLYRTYKLIVSIIRKEKPFRMYKIDDSGRGFTFKKKGINEFTYYKDNKGLI
jgi:hypothetical protein